MADQTTQPPPAQPSPAQQAARQPRTKIPGWFVVLAVLITGGLTGWAILKRQGGGTSWAASPSNLPMRVTEVLSPGAAVLAPGNFKKVAGTGAAPAIRAGAQSRHEQRGACTVCHTVVDALGKSIPAIQTMSALPHRYQGGLCINCHTVQQTSGYPGSNSMNRALAAAPVAATAPVVAQAPQQAPAPTKPAPSEGAWQGMEVVPITRLTAAQYRIPANIRGLVVAEAEGLAARQGVQAGDVIVAVNALPVGDMRAFLLATQNGKLAAGSVDLLRGNRFLKVTLGDTAPAAPAAQQPAAAPQQPAAALQQPAQTAPAPVAAAAPAAAALTPAQTVAAPSGRLRAPRPGLGAQTPGCRLNGQTR